MKNNINNKEIIINNIERFDKYISNADTKANLILTLSSAILAITLFKTIKFDNNSFNHLKNIFIILSFLLNISLIFSIGQALWAIIPRNSNSNRQKSFLYFEDVKNMDVSELKRRINTNTNDELAYQSIELARICSKKMSAIKRAYYGLAVSFSLILILSILNLMLN